MGVQEIFVDSPGPGTSADDMPYRAVGAAVIALAVSDFGGWPWRDARFAPMESSKDRALWLSRAIEAGRFLLERDDDIVRMWFALAGISPHHARKHRPWIQRLAALRATEAEQRRKAQATVRPQDAQHGKAVWKNWRSGPRLVRRAVSA